MSDRKTIAFKIYDVLKKEMEAEKIQDGNQVTD